MIQQLDLNGTWKIRWSDGERGRPAHALLENPDEMRYLAAEVPGEIHMDVWKAGLIADPYVGTNVLSARWVEELYWSYRREFDAPADALKSEHVWLNFEGLDYFAVILLNGEEVGRHENSFYPCRIDIAGKLRPGQNILVVHIEGGLYGASDKPALGYTTDNGANRERITKRHWLRKPQCQFNWDWSTRFINVGIFKPVTLEWSADPIRMDQLVALATVSPDLTQGQVKIRWFGEGLGETECMGKMRVVIPQAGVGVETEIAIKPGLHPLECVVTVSRPALWWPVGHGSQERYQVEVSLEVNGALVAKKETLVGFRHVVINQDAHPQGGRYFVVEVNGKKIFAKGGNFVPGDMIFARLNRARYATLIDRALEANYNLLRVWGGGIYESDDLYDLCDEMGILVWQEFIFACGKYPATDETFFRSVCKEAVYNIRRLAAHPSLIIWCGNNEMEYGNWHWGYDKGVVYPDHGLFHITLPRLLAEEDGTRYYQPSSPFSPDGQDPEANDSGDQHPWSVGFQNGDFRDYRKMICRFPNEGGILGPTALPTVLACLPEGQRFPGSFAWQVHDNSVDTWEDPSPTDGMLRLWLGLDPRQMTIEQFTFWAGLVQGEGLREYCENFRRRMFDSASAILWMYNDCWPVVRSWTIVDYYLRRTPSFHPVRRAMAPMHLVVVEEGDEVVVFGVNDTNEIIHGQLRYGIFSLAGAYIQDAQCDVALQPNASTRLTSIPSAAWADRTASMPFAMLTQGGRLLARARTFSRLFKEISWPNADVQVSVRDGQAIFACDTFAWNICLELAGDAKIADNFFDVYPGIPYSIAWKQPTPPRILHIGNTLPKMMKQIPG
jgi:beta-mannosidase